LIIKDEYSVNGRGIMMSQNVTNFIEFVKESKANLKNLDKVKKKYDISL